MNRTKGVHGAHDSDRARCSFRSQDAHDRNRALRRATRGTVSVARCARTKGSLMVELLVAMALLTGTLLPLAYSLVFERRLARATYQRAVAMEIVDGEMGILAAGEWRVFGEGTRPYPVHAAAAANLPPGQFLLTVAPDRVRLEWQPAVKRHGGAVVRELRLK